ncbi:hypothetical protein [Noviherbaspirillum saxi]|uniref:DUF2489 domain-containing protein n=1 Tax=Noviherbaspirillum saxi TaxID=2320863 RepID=A0A3A3FJD1_9BURK|nr:hypothetical protein [Noviherbaspirillum saxi]RJF92664.1 hypothetical protein D3871_29220 [Noviherbaspirillum saxi]
MGTALPIIVALVAGFFSLLGGFFGAKLTRRTEYEKWLRQERGTVFGEFLRQINKAQAEALDAIYSTERTDLMRDIRVSEIFQPLRAQENIVRLYLHPDDRQAFSEEISKFIVAYSPTTEQMKRLKQSEATLKHVQEVFERTIFVRPE